MRIKIGIVITSLQMGGLEKSISTLANYFSEKEQIEIVVFTLYRFKHFYKLNSKIKIIEPNFSKKKWDRLLYYFRIFFYFRRQFKLQKPDVILTFHEYCNFQVIIASMGLKIPVVISDRASPTLKITFPSNIIRKFVYPMAIGVICQTQRAKECFREKFGTKPLIKVIPNPINMFGFPKDNPQKKNQIVWVGRFHPVKGINYIIDAFKMISKLTDWNLVLVGDGPLFNNVKREVEENNLIGRVHFTGKTDNVFKYLIESEIFVFTSLSEGFPNALCEAMASGLACVSFDCDAGPSDIIVHGENGFLVDYLSLDDLIKKLLILIQDENLRLDFQHAAVKIKDKLDLNKIGNEYLEFILSVAAKNKIN